MSFYQNKRQPQCARKTTLSSAAKPFLALLSFCVFVVFAAHAQIHIPPNTAGVPNEPEGTEGVQSEADTTEAEREPLIPNEYAGRYKEAPKDAATSVTWYAHPQKIASSIPLGEIEVYVRRFEDDSPYLEKTLDKKKGRIFLKETRGLLYRIYDVIFVPYIPLENVEKPAKDVQDAPLEKTALEETKELSEVATVGEASKTAQKAEEETENVEKLAKDAQDAPLEETALEETKKLSEVAVVREASKTAQKAEAKTTLVKKEDTSEPPTEQPNSAAEDDATRQDEKTETKTNQEAVKKDAEVEERQEEEPQEEVPTRVPSYEERHTGRSLFVEIQKLRSDGLVDLLVRYGGQELLFSETYQYTSKGALRTLNRKYSDTSLVRFVYYFTGGGLEEEFHQNADKSVYYKKYTQTGQLKESARYDSEGALQYKITYSFAKDGSIESEEEMGVTWRARTEYRDGKKYETLRYEKSKAEDGTEKESVVSRVRYDYKSNTNSSSDKNEKFLHEKSSESFFNKEGTLVKKREYVDFALTKEIEYADEDVRIETQFFKDKPVLRIHYVGARKERVEILK